MHPLTNDLSGLSDEDLFNKKNELSNKLNYAYRAGYSDMVMQIQLILEDYSFEIDRRNRKMMDDAQKSGRLGKSGDDSAKDITR